MRSGGTSPCSRVNVIIADTPSGSQTKPSALSSNTTKTSRIVLSSSSAALSVASVSAVGSNGLVASPRKLKLKVPEHPSQRHESAWISSTCPVVIGSSPYEHCRSEQSTPAYPTSQTQPKMRSASHGVAYVVEYSRLRSFLVAARARILKHLPWPLQPTLHSESRSHADPEKPESHSHRPLSRLQRPRFEHSLGTERIVSSAVAKSTQGAPNGQVLYAQSKLVYPGKQEHLVVPQRKREVRQGERRSASPHTEVLAHPRVGAQARAVAVAVGRARRLRRRQSLMEH